MTNETIPNVPRELLERASNLAFQTQHYPLHEELRTLLSAPSPAGVDWLDTDRNAAFKACPESGCDWGSFYLGWKARGEVEQAIIDGLRGEVEGLRAQKTDWVERATSLGHLADQHAQRLGELEGLLREVAATLAWIANGECRALHDGPIMPSQMALDAVKAALGGSL